MSLRKVSKEKKKTKKLMRKQFRDRIILFCSKNWFSGQGQGSEQWPLNRVHSPLVYWSHKVGSLIYFDPVGSSRIFEWTQNKGWRDQFETRGNGAKSCPGGQNCKSGTNRSCWPGTRIGCSWTRSRKVRSVKGTSEKVNSRKEHSSKVRLLRLILNWSDALSNMTRPVSTGKEHKRCYRARTLIGFEDKAIKLRTRRRKWYLNCNFVLELVLEFLCPHSV